MQRIATGKVRDIYELDDEHLLMVSTDRISAFDVVMGEPIGDRGRVLTALTAFWLETVAADLPNHLVSLELPAEASGLTDAAGRSMVVRKAEMVPIEFIVRGYLAGSGWKEYQESATLHGESLPSGMRLGDKLPAPVVTPSTKGDVGEHDINLTRAEAVDRVGTEVMKLGEELALTVYGRAEEWAAARSLVLADTKFELGYIDGNLSLCDEVLTPDSSRYWPSSGWQPGDTPPAFDKQPLRDWLEKLGWAKTPPPPPLPSSVVAETRARYVEAYERLTGRTFADWPGVVGR